MDESKKATPEEVLRKWTKFALDNKLAQKYKMDFLSASDWGFRNRDFKGHLKRILEVVNDESPDWVKGAGSFKQGDLFELKKFFQNWMLGGSRRDLTSEEKKNSQKLVAKFMAAYGVTINALWSWGLGFLRDDQKYRYSGVIIATAKSDLCLPDGDPWEKWISNLMFSLENTLAELGPEYEWLKETHHRELEAIGGGRFAPKK